MTAAVQNRRTCRAAVTSRRFDDAMFFAAVDQTSSLELWRSDGTEAGTVLLKDVSPGSSYGYPGSGDPRSLTNVNGTLFFTATEPSGGRERDGTGGDGDAADHERTSS